MVLSVIDIGRLALRLSISHPSLHPWLYEGRGLLKDVENHAHLDFLFHHLFLNPTGAILFVSFGQLGVTRTP
ncbi:Chaperone protein DnaJ [Fusarium oxysporum f. sp. albedinis]|nr:Chaperone protein DnaJ [Fusarium oxysporum f. sp. albedinis]